MFSAVMTLHVLRTAWDLFGPTFLTGSIGRLRSTGTLKAKPGPLASDDGVR